MGNIDLGFGTTRRSQLFDAANDGAVPVKATYQAGGSTAAMAAIDLRSEAAAREALLNPPPAFDQAAFEPQEMEVPELLSSQEFVRQQFPQLIPRGRISRRTYAGVFKAYRDYMKQVASDRKTAQIENNRMGMGRERLDLDRAKFNAQEAARRLDKDEFNTFEALVVDRMQKISPDQWADDRAIALWARMKGATRGIKGQDPLPSREEQIAKVTLLAYNEFIETGQPGAYANALALMTSPINALKLLKGAEDPKTLAELKAQAAAGAIKDVKDPKKQLEILQGRGDLSLIGTQGFKQETFGELGGYGGITSDLKAGIGGFVNAVKRFEQMSPAMNDKQRGALATIIRQQAPTPEELINAGPAFVGADGKKRGTGELSEQQVNSALQFVLTPEQRQQLGP